MKYSHKIISAFLCIVIVLSSMGGVCLAADSIDSEGIIEYNVPLISSEKQDSSSLTIYGIGSEYYLNMKDIAALTRCKYEEKDDTIVLTQGIRELTLNIKTCKLSDSGISEQGNIDLKKYNGEYLCAAVPMLKYLGAECSVDEDLNKFQVLMPEITFWEAFMPDYLDYHFNTEEWMGSETEVEISLACDIIMDLLDVTNGNGMYSTDEHYEDALYDILDVDLYSYESVQQVVGNQSNKLQDFLLSETFSDAYTQGTEVGQAVSEGYADYYMTAKIAVGNVNAKHQYLQENYETASQIGQKINKNVCKQVDLKSVGKNAVDVAAIALDTAYNTYKLMCYDEDSRTLFSTCITDDIEAFTDYDVEYLQKITNKISSDIETDQSIVANVIVDEISGWAYSEIKDKGIELAASAFDGGNIYVFATKLGVMLAEIPLRSTINAYSDDMDMIWLAATQTDVAQLATRYMLTALRDEKASNVEHIEMVKNLMSLYYRTTIAFCENAIVSCEKFGNANTKDQTCEYLKQVSDYMASYLYLMTNCKVVPIQKYDALSDDIMSDMWMEKYESNQSDEWKQAYIDYVEKNGKISDSFGHFMEIYKLVKVNSDDIPELYINFGSTVKGDVLCSYYNGSIIEQPMWNYGFSYLEGQNLFIDSGGHMDVYYDKIYCIKDGKFILLDDGEYGASDDAHIQYDADGYPIYNYYWNGIEVSSQSEYIKLLNASYNTQKAICPFDGAEYDSGNWRYIGNGLCDYEEILEAIKNY